MVNVQSAIYASACLFRINDLIYKYCFNRNAFLKKFFPEIETEWEKIKIVLNSVIKNNVMIMDSQESSPGMQGEIPGSTEISLNPNAIDFLYSLIKSYRIKINEEDYVFSDPPLNSNSSNTWRTIENIYLEMMNIHKQIILYQIPASKYYGTTTDVIERTPAQLTPFLSFNVPMDYDNTLYFSETSFEHMKNCMEEDYIMKLLSSSPEDFLNNYPHHTMTIEKENVTSEDKIDHDDGTGSTYSLYVFEPITGTQKNLFAVNRLTGIDSSFNSGHIDFYDGTDLMEYVKTHRDTIICPLKNNTVYDNNNTYTVGLNSFVIETTSLSYGSLSADVFLFQTNETQFDYPEDII